MSAPCPDCTADYDADRVLQHDESCPLGRGYDQMQAADRMWFALHPKATERRRSPHWAEVAEMRQQGLVPDGAEVHGEIIVRPVGPGMRMKLLHDLYWVMPRNAEVTP